MKRSFKFALACCFVMMLSGCAETQLAAHYAKRAMHMGGSSASQGKYKVGNPYKIKNRVYTPREQFRYSETGIASWYGPGFHGKLTANGEIYDQYELTAAHRTLQMPALVKVTNLENGRTIVVRINDRGPFAHNRIIDLSRRGAELLGFKEQGTAKVRVDILGDESRQIAAAAKAGGDTSKIQTAGLYDKVGTDKRFEPVVLQRRSTVHDPSVAVLVNDARALELPESLVRPTRTGLGLEKVEVVDLTEPNATRSGVVTRAPKSNQTKSTEVDYLKGLDFAQNSRVQGHADEGRFVPDPVVTKTSVAPTKLYVQAGAFGVQQNAQNLAHALADLGTVTITPITGTKGTLHRVRVGPIPSVDQADIVLKAVIDEGHPTARIMVD